MSCRIVYHRASEMELVDLYESRNPEDVGRPWLPTPALCYRPESDPRPSLIRPWVDTVPGFLVHFAISPPVEIEGDDGWLIRSLWASYRQSADGLLDRLATMERDGYSDVAGELRALFYEQEFTRIRRGRGEDEEEEPDPNARIPLNFIVSIRAGDSSIPWEKGSGCDAQNWSLLVASVPTPHVALWLARRLSSSTRRLCSDRYTTRLVVPGGACHVVIAPWAAYVVSMSILWRQLPVWRQGTVLVIGPGTPHDFWGERVHVLPPHVPPWQPLLVDGEASEPAAKPRVMVGDMLPPERDAAKLRELAAKSDKVPKKPKKSKIRCPSMAQRSRFDGEEFRRLAQRHYRPLAPTATLLYHGGPLTLEALLAEEQGMARGDDVAPAPRRPLRTSAAADPKKPDAYRKNHTIEALVSKMPKKRAAEAPPAAVAPPPAKKQATSDIRAYFQ